MEVSLAISTLKQYVLKPQESGSAMSGKDKAILAPFVVVVVEKQKIIFSVSIHSDFVYF